MNDTGPILIYTVHACTPSTQHLIFILLSVEGGVQISRLRIVIKVEKINHEILKQKLFLCILRSLALIT